MMSMGFGRCDLCGEYHWADERCELLYYVQIPDYHGDDEWARIHAKSHESAVEKYCVRKDAQGDYGIISEGGLDAIFAKDVKGNIKKFSVNAHAEPQYEAREISIEAEVE